LMAESSYPWIVRTELFDHCSYTQCLGRSGSCDVTASRCCLVVHLRFRLRLTISQCPVKSRVGRTTVLSSTSTVTKTQIQHMKYTAMRSCD
jgi:hypothetical protein